MTVELKEILKKELSDGKLSCAKAFQLAKEHKVSLAEVGKAADEANIKIAHCQLGCFH